MKKILVAICAIVAMAAPLMGADKPDFKPERHVFTIHDFHTESRVTLPEAHVVYGTYGHLNATHDNVILMPSHYMANLHGYEWLMGPGHAIDLEKYFVVTSELFGNGSSSSPSNTP